MISKTVLVVFAQLFVIQNIAGQYIGYAAPRYAGPAAALSASNGPGLLITSSSPIAPIGVSIASENVIEGAVAVAGALPFLGTVGLEGVLPTAGAGNVAYNCGNGAVAITAEDIAAGPYDGFGPLGYGAGLGYGYGAELGYGYGAGLGYGYGAGLGYGYGAGPLGYGASYGLGYGRYGRAFL